MRDRREGPELIVTSVAVTGTTSLRALAEGGRQANVALVPLGAGADSDDAPLSAFQSAI